MKFKKIFAAALALCIVGGAAPTAARYAPGSVLTASAEEYSGTCGEDLAWTLTEDGTLTISGTGDMYDFSSSSDEMPWYDYRKQITSVIIEEGVTCISAEAFFLCTAVVSVDIPSTVENIDESALATCMGLETINVSPDNLNYSSLDGVLFNKDRTILLKYPSNRTVESYTVPDTVLRIENRAMWILRNMTSLTLPDGLKEIGEGALYNSKLLETIDIPESVDKIQWSAFSKTEWFTARQAEDPLVAVNGILIDGTACTGDIVIPDDIHTINELAMSRCEAITSVTIPSSVKTVDYCAFAGCEGIAELTIAEGVENIGIGAFSSCTSLAEVTVPASVSVIGEGAFYCCESLERITILDPDCDICDEEFTICNSESSSKAVFTGTICGYENSTAQAYAEKYGYNFVALDGGSDVVYGDANSNATIEMADAVLILQSQSNPDKYGVDGTEEGHITAQGMINADCSGSGDGVTAKDALAIQKYLLDLITLPEE